MLRVFGITYDHTMNYGSCLQAYALQEAVKQLRAAGTEPCSYALIPIAAMEGYPKDTGKKALLRKFLPSPRGDFRRFEDTYMQYADCASLSELPKLNDVADAFVCGSDVIWRPDLNKGRDEYYLNFARKYAFSYAASFGVAKLPEADEKKLPERLSRLREISVRERSGAEVIGRVAGREALVVADPVLLHDGAFWSKLVADQKKPRGGYIFVYTTHISPNVQGIIQKLRAQTGCRVVKTAPGPMLSLQQGILKVRAPREWLSLLANADYVVTNSFHATAFCMLLEKNTFVAVNGAMEKGANVRMYEFLRDLGMAGRLFNSVPETVPAEAPDFTEARERLAKLRASSYAYLQRCIDAAYREKQAAEEA